MDGSVLRSLVVVVICITIIFSLAVFDAESRRIQNGNSTSSTTTTTTAADGGGKEPEEETEYRIVYKDVSFVSEEDRESWRERLIALISNERVEVYEGDGLAGYEYPYPDRPGIVNGFGMGLYDLDLDGVPELLVNQGGGSAGNYFYEVYDITTGENIGSYDGSANGSICVYLNRETGEYVNISHSSWRSGWDSYSKYMSMLDIGEPDTIGNCICDKTLFSVKCYIVTEGPDEDDVHVETTFWANGEHVLTERFFAEYDKFMEDHIKIADTSFVYVDRNRTKETVEEFVDKLLSTEQEFVVR